MVEGEANGVNEKEMLEALWYGQESVIPIIEMQEELKKSVGKKKRIVEESSVDSELKTKTEKIAPKLIRDALSIKDKIERYEKLDILFDFPIKI